MVLDLLMCRDLYEDISIDIEFIDDFDFTSLKLHKQIMILQVNTDIKICSFIDSYWQLSYNIYLLTNY